MNQPAKNSVTRPDTLTSQLAPPPRRVGLPPCMERASAANPLTADQTLLLLPCSGAPCWSLPSLLGPDASDVFAGFSGLRPAFVSDRWRKRARQSGDSAEEERQEEEER